MKPLNTSNELPRIDPPKWVDRFLEWFCAPDLLEEVQGDLYETFEYRLSESSPRKAKFFYIWQVFTFLNWSTIRGNESTLYPKNPIIMFSNYFKIALRNLMKYKSSTLLNVLGLSVGITCFMLISLYVDDELKFDRFHENSDRIYRIITDNYDENGERIRQWVTTSPGFAPLLASEYGAVENATRINMWVNQLLKVGDQKISVNDFVYAEPQFLEIFSYPFIQGDASTALNDPNSIVITENTALKIFGNTWKEQNLIGKTIMYQRREPIPLKVTGVMEDVPYHSHLQFDVLCSFGTLVNFYGGLEEFEGTVGNFNYPSFLLLSEGSDIAELKADMEAFGKKYIPTQNDREFHKIFKVNFQALTDIHLSSNTVTEYSNNGKLQNVYTFAVVGILVLLLACINYMNLATARFSRRSKEVGVRKAMGAKRKQLIAQFLTEAVLVTVFSSFFAIFFLLQALPELNDFAEKEISLGFDNGFFNIGWLLLIVVGIGILSGSYPAIFLSKFNPVKVLKQEGTTKHSGSTFRSALVVFQFVVSIGLIGSLGIVNDQMNYIRNKDLGFERDQVLYFYANSQMRGKWDTFKQEILKHNGIKKIAGSSRVPSGRLADSSTARFYKEGDTEGQVLDFRLAMIRADEGFLDTYEIDLVAGENLPQKAPSDSTQQYLINEITAKRIGFSNPRDAVGQRLSYGRTEGNIIGVVADFNFESLHSPIAPIIFYSEQQRYYYASVQIEASQTENVLSYLSEIWKNYETEYPFNYTFVDENFESRYRAEVRMNDLFTVFAGLAILIGCLGLIGLVGFTVEQKDKEIGIRKVLGASIGNIVYVVTNNFVKLILIAFVLATPLVYYFMSEWLGSFAYHTEFNWVILLVSGGSALAISLATISFQTLKTAIKNPIKALRSE